MNILIADDEKFMREDLQKAVEPNIIFLTSHTEYLQQAVYDHCSGYILKPVIDSELKEALDNLRVPVTKKISDRRLTAKCFGHFEV